MGERSDRVGERSERVGKHRDAESRCCILVRERMRGSAVRRHTGLERDAPPPPEDVLLLLQQCRRAPARIRRVAAASAAPMATTSVDLRVCERHAHTSVSVYRERDPNPHRWMVVATASSSATASADPRTSRAAAKSESRPTPVDDDRDRVPYRDGQAAERSAMPQGTRHRTEDEKTLAARPSSAPLSRSASHSRRIAQERYAALEEALRGALDERNAVGTLLDALRSEHLDVQQQAEAAAKNAADSIQRTRDDADAHCKTMRVAYERQLDEMRAHANRLQADCEMLRNESDQKSDMLAALLRENVRHRADLEAWPVTHADRVREVQEEAERHRTQLLERLKKSRDALYDAEQRVQALEAAADELHAAESERSRLVAALRKKISALEDAAESVSVSATRSTPSSPRIDTSRSTTPRASSSSSLSSPSSPVFSSSSSRVSFAAPGRTEV